MCDAIILAAGFSSRMGAGKMSLAIRGKSVLARVIETLRETCGQIVVVGGYKIKSIKKITDEYPDVILVENKDYEQGMFSSVKRGVMEMKGDFFLIPGDCPAVSKETFFKLGKGTGDFIVPVTYGRRGHPVLIRKNLIPVIIDEPVDSNLKAVRDRCETEFMEVNDEGILLDIDTKDDFAEVAEFIIRRES